MKSTLVRTAIVTSLVTALVVSALSLYAFPRLMNTQNSSNPDSPYTLQPAVYNGPSQDDYYAPAARPRLLHRASYSQPVYSEPATYSSPTVHRGRSTQKSVLIVAGSAGTGAAIGALAGGRKGAAIGALAGGLGGFIYDRATANR